MVDETQQMIEVLFEVLPFYGQGDHSIDSIVTETLQRLPSNYLDTTDSTTWGRSSADGIHTISISANEAKTQEEELMQQWTTNNEPRRAA